MENLACPPVAERLYGLSLIWQEANYNFAFFDRLPELDWEASYREFIPIVISAEDLIDYYHILARFIALLKDGHSLVIPPISVHRSLDRPKLTLVNIGRAPIVTNASQSIGSTIPVGSELLGIDGCGTEEYLSTQVIPVISETTPHRLRDMAMARILLGRQDSQVHCIFRKPDGVSVEAGLLRNRHKDQVPWLRPSDAPDRSEFSYFDEWFYDGISLPTFEFKKLEGNIGYMALNTFMDPTIVKSFDETLPLLEDCSRVIIDLRKNHGGDDGNGYAIASHFLRQPTETCLVHSQEHNALYRARGVNLKDTSLDKVPELSEMAQTHLRCYRRQWFREESWGQTFPARERLSMPTVILTSSETGSAAEDFVIAFQSGKGQATLIGSSTAGSSGQPLIQDLPGGGMFSICTVRMPWQAERSRKGIEPDIWVEPTVEDIIHDEDRALAAALRHLQA